jgi:hypothetical protein
MQILKSHGLNLMAFSNLFQASVKNIDQMSISISYDDKQPVSVGMMRAIKVNSAEHKFLKRKGIYSIVTANVTSDVFTIIVRDKEQRIFIYKKLKTEFKNMTTAFESALHQHITKPCEPIDLKVTKITPKIPEVSKQDESLIYDFPAESACK